MNMKMFYKCIFLILIMFFWDGIFAEIIEGGEFSIASYNVKNFRLKATSKRAARPLPVRKLVAETIAFARPDIVALQEIGSQEALNSMQQDLSFFEASYPHQMLLPIADQDIQCGVLSRFPFVENRSSSQLHFLLYGKRFQVLRGLVEVDIEITKSFKLTLLNVHLKSQVPTWYADEMDFRLAEAIVIRSRIDALFREDPQINLVVLGDLNDHPDSLAVKKIKGRGKRGLIDCRPFEMKEEVSSLKSKIAWTHYFEKRDLYCRFDYILISSELEDEWIKDQRGIPHFIHWAEASDHRLIQCFFHISN